MLACVSIRIDRIVAGNRSGARRLLGPGILARGDHCMGISGGYRLVAFTGVIRPVHCPAVHVLHA
jgi:hypothetical protein